MSRPDGPSALAPEPSLTAHRPSVGGNGLRPAAGGPRLQVQALAPAAALLLVVSGAAVGAYSVPRYEVWIVLAYAALAAVLAVSAVRGLRPAVRPPAGSAAVRIGAVLALAVDAVLIEQVPSFSYVTGLRQTYLLALAAGAALVAAALIALPRSLTADLALTAAACGYAVVAGAALRLDAAPRIDVWYTLQGAADGLLQGQDMYQQVWVAPPGPMQAFTYLPWMAVLLAPGRWLLGDVRWALVAVTLGTAFLFRAMPAASAHRMRAVAADGRATSPSADGSPDVAAARGVSRAVSGALSRVLSKTVSRDSLSATAAAALLLLLPGTQTQVEQAWTEPLLLACLTLAMFALARGNGVLAVVAVALALASKQHILLLLPVLAAWPRFGVRRALASAGLAAALVLPWVIADPGAIWHDTVTLLVNFPPLRFADTAYIAVLNEWGVQPPFWLTGALVLGTLGGAAFVAHRFDPPAPVLVRWCALVLFVANLVNKQAFYNQYWLVAGLVLLSWAVPATAIGSPRKPSPSPTPTLP